MIISFPFQFILLFILHEQVKSVGMSSHLLISELALEFYSKLSNNSNHINHIVRYMKKHRQYLHAGSFFPDWGYLCSSHDAAEDSHWPLFWNASINHFQNTYRSEILLKNGSIDLSLLSENGQQLFSFLFGIYSHGVSDIVWHSLGLEEGFIQAMAAADFGGNFEAGHKYADPLSDIAISRFTSMTYLDRFQVPATDIFKIYQIRGFKNVTERQISQCVFLGQQITKANQAFGKYLFPILSPKTPFFTKELFHYHKGGILNMAVNVADCWRIAFDWFLTGVMTPCQHLAGAFTKRSYPQQLLLQQDFTSIQNSFTSKIHEPKREERLYEECVKNWSILYTTFAFHYCTTKRIFAPSSIGTLTYSRFKAKLQSLSALSSSFFKSFYFASRELFYPTCTSIYTIPTITITATLLGPAMFGSAVSSGFMGASKNRFIAISAPGYSSNNYGFMEGAVFIVPWSSLDSHQNHNQRIQMDITHISSQTINVPFSFPAQNGFEKSYSGARFGTAMVVLDFNLDGIDDLVISAPFYGTNNDTPDGRVFVYYGLKNGGFQNRPNVIISGAIFQRRNNPRDSRGLVLGEKVIKADVDGDGYPDLIILSPKATPYWGSPQYGQVHIFLSRTRPDTYPVQMDSNDADIIFTGSLDYSLFGNDVVVSNFGLITIILIGAPGFTLDDMQTSGAVYIYSIDIDDNMRTKFLERIDGKIEKGRFGSSLVSFKSDISNSSLSILICSPAENSNSSIPRFSNLPGIFVDPVDSGYQSGICRIMDLFFQFPNLKNVMIHNQVISGTSSLSWLGHSLLATNRSNIFISEPTVEAERGRVYKLQTNSFLPKDGKTERSIDEFHSGCWSGLKSHDRFGSSLAYDADLDALFVSSLHTKEANISLFMRGSLTIIRNG